MERGRGVGRVDTSQRGYLAGRMTRGPNFYIWIAIAVVVVSTIPALQGQTWTAAVGWPVALALAVFNKVRVIRRRRAERLQSFD